MRHELFRELQELRRRREPVALVTDLRDGAQALFVPGKGGLPGTLALSDEQSAAIAGMLHQSVSGPLDEILFVRSYAAPWTLLVVGAVHIAQFLAPMARLAGFDVTLIDPRRAFAAEHRFPGLDLIVGWPDEVMEQTAPPTRQTAVVTLAHDPKIDDPALFAALRSPAFYVGALGSARSHAKRVERLTAAGFGPADIARIAAPIGLDLGGRAPAEIAVSVLAEVVGARYGRQRVPR
ncbi:XdhC family protein [Telmatospirillum siberiense]|uniref:Xanthine dehydrogenase n=1 Tax=Telmatospirillum siberiense TaxID=382514 RepID=A0A2N3PQH2_9PROT|nr:XdhC family protein [Telmatospirillum siberiense]PKU22632.1 xanthine dehydrogenase [Telmatospirillum siberiense]